ncbi:MAG: hypothetical protein ACI8RD_002353 [Bacillariaceae sp.]|jgi:hypothetical protein
MNERIITTINCNNNGKNDDDNDNRQNQSNGRFQSKNISKEPESNHSNHFISGNIPVEGEKRNGPKITRTPLKQQQQQQSSTTGWQNRMNRFWSKAAPETQKKVTQPFNNTYKNIQT